MTHELTLRVGSPHVLRDHIAEAVVGYSQGSNIRHTLEDLLAQVADQLPTRTEEPEEFASVVRAGIDGLSDRLLWQRSASGYWFSETSRRAWFSDLHHPEVLRVGVGDDTDMTVEEFDRAMDAGTPAKVNVSLARTYTKTIDPKLELERKNWFSKGYDEGLKTATNKHVDRLKRMRVEALTAERQNAYDRAIEAIEGAS